MTGRRGTTAAAPRPHSLSSTPVGEAYARDPIRPRRRDERGASAVEYGLLIAGIAALIVVAVFAFGGGARGLFHGSCYDIIENQSLGSCP